jgi:glycosyltransferase involved in cell wall biosynthesis
LKVLFVTKFYPPTDGGIERYSQILCTGMREQGVEIEVVAAAQGERTSRVEEVDGIKVHRLGLFANLRGAPVTPGTPALLRRLAPEFDLVHHNFPNPWSELCHLVFCGTVKTLVTYHSDIFRQKVLLQFYKPWIHKFLRRTSAIIATSPNYIVSSPMLSQYQERCHSIPLPVITAPMTSPADVADIEEQYGDFVLFVGRLVYYKGLEYLIEAMGQLPGIQLVVVGRGPMEKKYKALAQKLGQRERIHFLGRVDDKQLKAFHIASRCFALPSIFRSEAFGMVLGEAMSYGTPVISTELGTGTSYINRDGETGFVVPPADPGALAEKISLLCRDRQLRSALGENARKRVAEEFSKEQMIQKTLGLYRELAPGA